MEDKQTAGRPSGIPRLSRLPVPRSSSIRTAPSKENLGTSTQTLTKNANPKLRPSPSRDTISSASTLRKSVGPKLQAKQPVAKQPTVKPTTDKVRATSPFAQPPSEEISTPKKDIPQPNKDEILFKRPLVLTRRPSETWAQSPAPASAGSGSSPGSPAAGSPPGPALGNNAPQSDSNADNGFNFDFHKPRPARSRPSLAERTMETLSQLPSSPAISKKTSLFFEPQSASKPRSRAGSGASRPGSGYKQDPTNRPSSRASRPGSSSGTDETATAASRATFRSALPPVSGTPTPRGVRSTKSQTFRTPAKAIPSAMPRMLSPSPGSHSLQRKPSGPLGTDIVAPKTRATAPRSLKPRPSLNGLLRKPSARGLNKSEAGSTIPPAEPSPSAIGVATTWDGSIPTHASSTLQSAAGAEDTAAETSRKSSAALREQIAKAKAAKRAALRQASQPSMHKEVEAIEEVKEARTSPTPAETFEPEPEPPAASDPFNMNQRRSEAAKSKIIQQRVGAGRASGRLNIAAMGLKSIPAEVLKMYDMEAMGTYDGSWAESVDLTRFIAADNEIERIDDTIFPDKTAEDFAEEEESQGNIFGGLETLDLHGNLLVALPLGLRRLGLLTSLNLSNNRLTNNCLEVISQLPSLRDLKLSSNLLYGPLDPCFSNLSALEILDIQGNNVSALPTNVERLSRLRILNINENSFESLPFSSLAQLPLTELTAKKNKLAGTLIQDSVEAMPNLQSLDVSCNQIQRIVSSGEKIRMPCLHQLTASMNRLQELPDISSWTSLLTLIVDENSIAAIPASFCGLEKLRHADFTSNDIRIVPPEIGRMDNLAMMRLSGNPLRDKKFGSITTDELKEILSGRLEPPPPYQEPTGQVGGGLGTDDVKVTSGPAADGHAASPVAVDGAEDEDSRSDLDDFATPPTSAPNSPSRSRSHTLTSSQTWPVKTGGMLDRSHTESSSLHPVVCSRLAAAHKIREVQLHHNLFTALPDSLSFFAETLTALSLARNQLVGESYLAGDLELPALKELNLASNHVTGLGPLVKFLKAPALEKLDVSFNRLAALPTDLRDAFPGLVVLLASNNHLVELDPETIRGMQIVDAGNNDIAHLNPRIGLLGGEGGLQRLEVSGNRFRVPRWSVLERGTEATLRWLRGRVPVAEMAGWRGEGGDDADDVD